MGFLDKVKKQMGQHGDKVDRAVDKTADTADKKTQGKYNERIRNGSKKAKDTARRYSSDEGDKGGGR